MRRSKSKAKSAGKAGAKRKSAKKQAKSADAKADAKAAGAKAKPDKTTIRLASKEVVEDVNDKYDRFKKNAASVSGDISALKLTATKARVHWGALKKARELDGMEDAKLAVFMAHFVHYLDVMGVSERAKIHLDLFKENVAKDAKAAGQAASLVRRPTDQHVRAAADRAEESSAKRPRAEPIEHVGRGPARNGGDGETAIEQIKGKLSRGEHVSQAEREKLGDFDERPAVAH